MKLDLLFDLECVKKHLLNQRRKRGEDEEEEEEEREDVGGRCINVTD